MEIKEEEETLMDFTSMFKTGRPVKKKKKKK